MKVNIDHSKLTDAPYSVQSKDSFFFEDDDSIIQTVLSLKHGQPATYLISGYRGAGKTSFVNRVCEELGNDFLCININLAKYVGYPQLLKKLIRQLYLQYESKIKEDFPEDFKLLYDRTFNDIVNSKINSDKDENKTSTETQIDGKKLLSFALLFIASSNLYFSWISSIALNYIFFVLSFVLACIASFKINFIKSTSKSLTSELSRKSLYDDEIAEHHLLNMLSAFHEKDIKMLITFDEIDKIGTIDEIERIINDLKPLLLSGYASFFVISGQLLYYEYEKSSEKDDQVLSTLFSKIIHIPFLKYATLKKFCLSIILQEADKSEEVVNNFLDTFILSSGRIPRKLINHLRNVTVWEDANAYLFIDEDEHESIKAKAELLQVLTNLLDNDLPAIAQNEVQLDFFIAQIHLWLNAMRHQREVDFEMEKIVKGSTYGDYYPGRYISQLDSLGDLLTDRLIENNILGVRTHFDQEAPLKYYWKQTTEASSTLQTTPTPEDVTERTVDVSQEIHSTFTVAYTEMEEYLRNIYKEIIPDNNYEIRLSDLIQQFRSIGFLNDYSHRYQKIEELEKVRNKFLHGSSLNASDLNMIDEYNFTFNRLRAEINEDYALYICNKYLDGFEFIKSSRGGYDFVGTNDSYTLLFDVKYNSKGRFEKRSINEIVGKYQNYVQTTDSKAYYILFYFLPNRKKSFESFYQEFNDTVKALDWQTKLKLFHIPVASDQSIAKKIEDALDDVVSNLD